MEALMRGEALEPRDLPTTKMPLLRSGILKFEY